MTREMEIPLLSHLRLGVGSVTARPDGSGAIDVCLVATERVTYFLTMRVEEKEEKEGGK